MKAIRVRNLRSFGDYTSDIEPKYVNLKALNIFVGKNSCGKSTLLRSLPVLKQSASSKVTAPILWFGDFSDFGSFSTALHRNSDTDKIYFDYKFEVSLEKGPFYQRHFQTKQKKDKLDLEFKQGLCEVDGQTIVKSITINIEKSKIKIITLEEDKYDIYLNNKKILDQIRLFSTKSNLTLDLMDPESFSGLNPFTSDSHIEKLLSKNAINLQKITTKRVSLDRVRDAVINLGLCSLSYFKENSFDELLDLKGFNENWSKLTQSEIQELYENQLITFLPELLSLSSKYLEKFANSIKYIGPVRANGYRFTRHQEFNVQEIDPSGINIPAFLNRLSPQESEALAIWTKDNFNFTVRTVSDGLHHEVMIKYLDEDEENITDMGSGFSQILPIVISLWNETEKETDRFREKTEKIFAIEQPELHLHPEYQALFIKTLMKILKNTKNLRVILETHSKTIVDTISDNIEDGEFSSHDVSINIFEKSEKVTLIHEAEYDQDGSLINWPIGFLSGR